MDLAEFGGWGHKKISGLWETEFRWLSHPFIADIDAASEEVQIQLIDMQSDTCRNKCLILWHWKNFRNLTLTNSHVWRHLLGKCFLFLDPHIFVSLEWSVFNCAQLSYAQLSGYLCKSWVLPFCCNEQMSKIDSMGISLNYNYKN